MKIPLTRYGWPQAVFYPAMLLVFMIVLYYGASPTTPVWIVQYVEIALGVVLIWMLSFFRDPEREIPQDKNILIAPADGTIADIETVDEPDFIGGKALRVGIFLSIFDVHINRSPCGAKVEKITYRQGQFLDARNPQAGKVNESNDLWLTRIESPNDKLIVRQISGAIARRIVCKAEPGQNLAAGEKFGMIKFGSRTEVYVPARDGVECLVKTGDKVKAGLTPIIKL
ncbi:MAG: phosphatidylserine decarboxylase [Sedimentisphaerales bacterium]|jgi:phosphatidylserine decarboxylase